MITEIKNHNLRLLFFSNPFLIKTITSFFYIGYLPLIPGTFGSLAGFFIFIILKGNPYVLFSVTSLTLIMGFLLSGKAARLFSQSDSPRIVIDEVSGMLISFLGLPVALLAGLNPALVSGFIIFRIIDTIKIYPANRFHRLQGSLGIMGDDIIAGLYTNLILRLIFLLK